MDASRESLREGTAGKNSESMTHAYDVRTAGVLRRGAVVAATGIRGAYGLSQRGVEAARAGATRARLALTDAVGAAAASAD